jgi:hypothetical protein|tara:strand:- start:314 stop:517 length:204 start_codon:yes stop_codon:yes gene_type:complete
MVDYYTTPNQLVTKIKTLYSDLTDKDFDQMNGGTILLQNDTDGKGDYIKSWKHPTLSKPTKSELDSV